MLRIVFMGTPEFAVPSLQALSAWDGAEVVGVFTQPPRPAGRGHKEHKSPVHVAAEAAGVPVFTPVRLNEDAQRILRDELKPDVIVVAAYGLLLPQAVLDIAPCMNVHPSDLPRWRGAAPLHHTVLAGDKRTAVCIMKMDAGLDSGPVYLRQFYEVGENETTGELHDRFAQEGARLLVEVLKQWGQIEPVPQTEEALTYAHKLKSDELASLRMLDFRKPAQTVHNQIRGLSPWPGSVMRVKGEEVKVLGSEVASVGALELVVGKAGDIVQADAEGVVVRCGDGGLVRLTVLQRAGKKAMAAADFLRGFELVAGDVVACMDGADASGEVRA